MAGCNSITVETGNSNCTEGKWYERLPFQECAPGYEHPSGIQGAGICYCLSDAEAKAKLDCVNAGICTIIPTDPLAFLEKYWMYIVGLLVLLYIIGRR